MISSVKAGIAIFDFIGVLVQNRVRVIIIYNRFYKLTTVIRITMCVLSYLKQELLIFTASITKRDNKYQNCEKPVITCNERYCNLRQVYKRDSYYNPVISKCDDRHCIFPLVLQTAAIVIICDRRIVRKHDKRVF